LALESDDDVDDEEPAGDTSTAYSGGDPANDGTNGHFGVDARADSNADAGGDAGDQARPCILFRAIGIAPEPGGDHVASHDGAQHQAEYHAGHDASGQADSDYDLTGGQTHKEPDQSDDRH